MRLTPILALAFLAIAVAVIFATAKRKRRAPKDIAYEATDRLLTDGELAFRRTLATVTPTGACINAKVRLADIIKPDSSLAKSRWWAAFAKIQSKHVDFVLCDVESMKILCAIELHDKSHLAGTRVKRDDFVRQALAMAKVPYLEVKASRSYNQLEIRDRLNNALAV